MILFLSFGKKKKYYTHSLFLFFIQSAAVNSVRPYWTEVEWKTSFQKHPYSTTENKIQLNRRSSIFNHCTQDLSKWIVKEWWKKTHSDGDLSEREPNDKDEQRTLKMKVTYLSSQKKKKKATLWN